MENPVPPFPPQVRPTSGLAIASLVCGILGFPTCGLTGIPAVITGHLAMSSIKRGNGAVGGGGMALAGLITGYLSFCIMGVAFLSGLAAPVILKQRHAADRVQCASQLKEVYAALVEFEADYGSPPSDALSTKEAKFAGLTGRTVLDQLEAAGKVPETDELLKMRRSTKGDWYYFPNAGLASKGGDCLLVSPEIGEKRAVLRSDGSIDFPLSPVVAPLTADPSAIRIPPTTK